MNRIFGIAIVVVLSGTLAVAARMQGTGAQDQNATQGKTGTVQQVSTKTPARSSISAELKTIEEDWVNAAKAGDADKVSSVLDDGWVGIGPTGQKQTKSGYLDDIKSGKNKLESFDMGPLAVRRFGNTAIVNGSDTEKSSYDGKDTSGKFQWTDVFVNKNGEWKAVSSQITKVAGKSGGF